MGHVMFWTSQTTTRSKFQEEFVSVLGLIFFKLLKFKNSKLFNNLKYGLNRDL